MNYVRVIPGLSPRLTQHVAHAADSVDEARLVRIDLASKIGNIALYDVAVTTEIVVPHVIEDLGLAEHNLRVDHEVTQQLELGGGKIDDLAGLGDFVHVIIEGKILVGDDAGLHFFLGSHAAQDDAQAGDYLFEGEGLGDVVIRTDGQSVDAIFHAVLGSEEEDGSFVALGTKLAEEGESVHARHHDIQNECVWLVCLSQLEGVCPIVCGFDVEALELEADLDEV